MIIILDISLKDELKFSQEHQDKEFIKVSSVDSNTLNLDAIFINEKYSINKKEYYRLFVRPSLSNAHGYDYFKSYFQTSKENETTLNLKSGAIQFYVRTKGGMELLKFGKEDHLAVPSYSITANRSGRFTLKDFDFIEVDIPASFIEDQQEVFITYSASYNVLGEKIKPHNNFGSIEIDRRNLTQYNYNKADAKITIANLAYGYLNYDFNNKYKRHYFDLLRNDIELKMKQRSANTIDPIMEVKSVYSSWNYLDQSTLGNKMNTFLELFLKGLNRTEAMTSTAKLKSDFNFKEHYDIKKLNDNITQYTEGFTVKSTNKTSYSFPKNTVEENDSGTEGIVWNPLYKNNLIYNRVIDLNSRVFSIDYVNENLKEDMYKIDYSEQTSNLKYKTVIKTKIADLNAIGWKNKERIINYINEKEKII
ncbi:hypothetical protein [Spiroplasma sp. BIUS-1]|uniref:hypothetical protein n=1 Tax=Spiroplasma sp. BIUS-1 TaxID=216964 RepID=UPI00139808C0|nr:hypothetical protein [Spiroplasma sp. BIUS-1]QHX36969.1 hypothetical protein SBIUS_v1c07160 [Spiroplasma sp. BIUS-1]